MQKVRHALVGALHRLNWRQAQWKARLGGPDLVAIPAPRAGFFAAVILTLHAMRLAEQHGLRAFPWWTNDGFYHNPQRYKNAWDGFFEQPQPHDAIHALMTAPAASYRTIRPKYTGWRNDPDKGRRGTLHRLIHQYLRPVCALQATIDRFITEELEGRPYLGVHVRLTDAARGKESRVVFGPEDFFHSIDRWLEFNDGCIFVATDAAEALSVLRQRYGNRIRATDCLRSNDGTSIHGDYDAGVAGDPIEKGREVLIDGYILASSAHLLRVGSMVTVFSLCQNLSLTYEDLNVTHNRGQRIHWLEGP
ncbi:MAG: hypothetical protein ACFBZ8_07505 [Opitutales bacterium]